MSGGLYPKRSQMFDKTKSWEQELKDWERVSSKKHITDRNKSFANFKETIYWNMKEKKLEFQQTCEEYLEQQKLYELFESLMSSLITQRPADPIEHLI